MTYQFIIRHVSCNWVQRVAIYLLQVDLAKKKKTIASCDLYYDMKYTEKYHTFSNLVNGRYFLLRYDDLYFLDQK